MTYNVFRGTLNLAQSINPRSNGESVEYACACSHALTLIAREMQLDRHHHTFVYAIV